ncbi:MAG TPA: hypothetical protein VIU45_01855 [Chitinophagaceae bacterium]
MNYKIIILFFLGCLVTAGAVAQGKHALHKSKKSSVAPDHAANSFPVLTTSLGNVLSNTLPKSMMQGLLDSSLIARDQHNNVYSIVDFDFGYQRSETAADSTGQPKKVVDYLSWNFRANRLDSLWRTRIKAEINTGDELYFDHIVAEGSDGKRYKSSPLKFIIR